MCNVKIICKILAIYCEGFEINSFCSQELRRHSHVMGSCTNKHPIKDVR